MSANVESMFYVKEAPWHGLGVRVEEAQTSADALRMSGLDWNVVPKDMTISGTDEIVKGFKANVRDSDDKVLGVVSDRYKIVQNSEAFAFTDMLLGEGVRYETAGSLANGKRVWMLAKMDTTKICGDDVEPYLVFTNAHDGTGAVKVALTPIRVVCQNTLTVAISNAKRVWSTRHCGDISVKVAEAQNTLGLAHKYMESLAEQADVMSQIVVTNPMFLEYVNKMFPMKDSDSDRVKRNVQYQRNVLQSIYDNTDDIKKFHGTAYGVVNAVADFLPHFVPLRATKTGQENTFMKIADGASLMEDTCRYFQR